MKIYRTTIYLLLLLSVFFSCDDQTDGSMGDTAGQNAELSVITDAASMAYSLKSNTGGPFALESEIGLFVSHYMDIDTPFEFSGPGSNLKATYDGNYWPLEHPVWLNSRQVSVYAYYPYHKDNMNPRKIPIEHNSQRDYMYSSRESNSQEVNKYRPAVTLYMQHALCLVQFNVQAVNHPATYTVESVEIANCHPYAIGLISDGTIDISTGRITYGSASRPVKWENDGTVNTPRQAINMLVMPLAVPVSSPDALEGTIQVTFMVDGRQYLWYVPEGTQWESGTRYTYNMQLTGSEISLAGITIEDWKPGFDDTYPMD